MAERTERYRVDLHGSIVAEGGGILYDAQDIADLSRKARKRLAAIHTADQNIDWEHASEILEREGLITEVPDHA